MSERAADCDHERRRLELAPARLPPAMASASAPQRSAWKSSSICAARHAASASAVGRAPGAVLSGGRLASRAGRRLGRGVPGAGVSGGGGGSTGYCVLRKGVTCETDREATATTRLLIIGMLFSQNLSEPRMNRLKIWAPARATATSFFGSRATARRGSVPQGVTWQRKQRRPLTAAMRSRSLVRLPALALHLL